MHQHRQRQVSQNHEPAKTQVEPSRTQDRRLRRRTVRRVLASAAALALAATGALAIAPGTAHADAHRDGQWYLDDFNIDKVHELSQGEGVTIGVIDSGIDADHPDLKGNITEGAEFIKGDTDPHEDTSGHGTSVASVMAGHGHGKNNADGILGIAPKAKIVPTKIDVKNTPHAQVSDDFAEAIAYLVEQDVNIISVSMNVGSTPSAESSIKNAVNKGIPVVGSAGNVRGADSEFGENEPDNISWPAQATGVIPVSGTDNNHEFWEGSVNLGGASLQPQLGLSAPATNIPMARPNSKFATDSGTSLAAPIVAGTLALMKSAYPDLDLYTQQSRLLETVDDKGEKGFDDKYGWGIVNPYKALTEETTYTDADGNDTVSSPDDRLPLEEQGEPVSNVPPPDAVPPPNNTPDLGDKHKDQDEAATEAPGPPAWVTITIITTGTLLTAALITLVITKTRRSKKNPTSQGTGPLPPGQPGPLPPTATPGQPPNAFSPPQNQDQAPPPNPPGPNQPGPNQPPTNQTWQPPHDPNTNPPPQPPQ